MNEFAILDFTVRDGALCGVGQSGYDQGNTAAKLAMRILGGTSPADIPIQSPQKGIALINASRAGQLDINIPEQTLKEVDIVR